MTATAVPMELLAGMPQGDGEPTSVDGLATLATRSDVSNRVTLTADEPVTTRYLVVWLTSLPPSEGGFKGAISEVTVRP